MKKLTRVFQTKNSALRAAVREDDVALMQKLLGKKSDWLIFEVFKPENFTDMTPRMADTIVQHIHDGKNVQWGGGRGVEGTMMVASVLAVHASEAKNYALLDVFFDGRLDFCSDNTAAAVVRDLIGGALDTDKKNHYLKKALSVKTKLPEPEKAVEKAIDKSDLDALDILAATGINLRDNNDFWLREAAKNDKRHVCVHLVQKHGADMAGAMKAAQDLGTHNVYLYLDGLRQDIQPETATAEAPPTVESLSREVKQLRAALREMTALITDMQAERKIEKNLDKPGLHIRKNAP